MAIEKKKDTHRTDKLAALIQQTVGTAIQEYIEETNSIVTVSRVEVSRDARWAKVWISIVGGNDDRIMKTLEHQLYNIQGELNRKLTMKMVPRIQLYLDTSARYAAHISQLINKIHEEE